MVFFVACQSLQNSSYERGGSLMGQRNMCGICLPKATLFSVRAAVQPPRPGMHSNPSPDPSRRCLIQCSMRATARELQHATPLELASSVGSEAQPLLRGSICHSGFVVYKMYALCFPAKVDPTFRNFDISIYYRMYACCRRILFCATKKQRRWQIHAGGTAWGWTMGANYNL